MGISNNNRPEGGGEGAFLTHKFQSALEPGAFLADRRDKGTNSTADLV